MSGGGQRASLITITITIAILVTGCWLHPARAQVAPSVPPSGPSTALDLEGKVVREIRIGQDLRSSTVDIVQRHLASRQGLPFHHATLLEDRRRLDALRLFSAIEIKPVAAGDEVVLEVDVKETLRLLPYVALSVTDENGLSAGPAFRGINLLGRGSQSSGTLQFGGMTMVGARVTRPTVTPGAWALDVGVGYRSRRNELFDFDDEISTAIAGRAGWNWTDRVQVGGRAEYAWFDTGSSDVSLSPDGTDHLPAVGLSATYNSLDSLSNPGVGWFGSVDIGRQFGDADSWSLTIDGRRFQPLTARTTVSLVAFAAFQSGVIGRDLPQYMEFGLGGANSVRGWELGSRVGKNQAIGTVEYVLLGRAHASVHRVRAQPLWRHSGGGVQRRRPGVDRRFLSLGRDRRLWRRPAAAVSLRRRRPAGFGLWRTGGRCSRHGRHPPQGGQAARARAVTPKKPR